jgi:hypothetical protein
MKKLLMRGLIMLMLLSAFAAMIVIAFWVGKLEGALNPAWTTEKQMCVSQDVDIRESPTGYVIGTVPAGSALWFIKLELPFAHVVYFDGSAWLQGTVTAFVLELCK